MHRGLTTHIRPGDPRIAVIETLLYGRPLPPPMPVPELRDTTPPAAPPPVEVPPTVRAAWDQLEIIDRRLLLALARGPKSPAELEAILGVTQRQRIGLHSRIHRVAWARSVAFFILASGRGRSARRLRIAAEMVPWVLALAAEPLK